MRCSMRFEKSGIEYMKAEGLGVWRVSIAAGN